MPEEQVTQTQVTPTEIQTLFSWKAPFRIFKTHNRQFYSNASIAIFLICLFLIFLKEFPLVGVVLALSFFGYAIATVEPDVYEHKITTQGIVLAGRTYFWKDLKEFWFIDKGEMSMLNIDTDIRYPSRLFVVIRKEDENKIKEALSKYLSFQEQPKITWFDKASEFVATRFDLS